MKNQLDLISRMSGLMDSIEHGKIDADRARTMIQAADVIVEVMKAEIVMTRITEGAMAPAFFQPGGAAIPSGQQQLKAQATPLDEKEYQEQERARIAAEKQQRMARLGRV